MKLHHILLVITLSTLLYPTLGQLEAIDEMGQEAKSVLGFFAVTFGLIFGFFGLRIFKIMVFIIGFIIGFVLGAIIFGSVTDNAGVGLLGGLILGIGGGYFALFLRLVINFLFGFTLGACAAAGITIALGLHGEEATNTLVPLVLVLGIAGGIISVWIADLIVILSTAALGSVLSTIGIDLMASEFFYNHGILLLILLAMFGLGVYFQYHKREHWKQYSVTNNTTVNTNVSNNNTIEILMPTIAPQEQFAQPQSYPSGQYMQPGFPISAGFQPAYAQPGYPQLGYPQPGYPQPGFPQAGYPMEQQQFQQMPQGPVQTGYPMEQPHFQQTPQGPVVVV